MDNYKSKYSREELETLIDSVPKSDSILLEKGEGSNSIIAKGRGGTAKNHNTTSIGVRSKTDGYNSYSNGEDSESLGENTSTSGRYTKATNSCEFACGILNDTTESSKSSEATLFSVGNGNNGWPQIRHNTFEIKKNGDVYISNTNADGNDFNKPMTKLQDTIIYDVIDLTDGNPFTYNVSDGVFTVSTQQFNELKCINSNYIPQFVKVKLSLTGGDFPVNSIMFTLDKIRISETKDMTGFVKSFQLTYKPVTVQCSAYTFSGDIDIYITILKEGLSDYGTVSIRKVEEQLPDILDLRGKADCSYSNSSISLGQVICDNVYAVGNIDRDYIPGFVKFSMRETDGSTLNSPTCITATLDKFTTSYDRGTNSTTYLLYYKPITLDLRTYTTSDNKKITIIISRNSKNNFGSVTYVIENDDVVDLNNYPYEATPGNTPYISKENVVTFTSKSIPSTIKTKICGVPVTLHCRSIGSGSGYTIYEFDEFKVNFATIKTKLTRTNNDYTLSYIV